MNFLSTIPRQRRRSLGLCCLLLFCFATFAILIHFNQNVEQYIVPSEVEHNINEVKMEQQNSDPNEAEQNIVPNKKLNLPKFQTSAPIKQKAVLIEKTNLPENVEHFDGIFSKGILNIFQII